MYAHTEKKLEGRIKLLEGRKAAGNMELKEFLDAVADECQNADPTIPLDSNSINTAFLEFRDRWFSAVPQTMDEINAAYRWPGYVSLLYECFFNWTFRSTALSIQFLKRFNLAPEKVLVYSDGVGAASCLVATAFPDSDVICHIMGDQQIEIAKRLKERTGLNNMRVTTVAEPCEVLMAFESFEHFTDPIAVAGKLIESSSVLMYTAPWKVKAHGHFHEYGGMPCEKYSKHFGKYLRNVGFVDSNKAVGFKFFNAYPRVYLRNNNS